MRKRIEREKKTVSLMIGMYCGHHHTRAGLCESCSGLKDYAMKQTANCRFGQEKPVCSACPVHCYKRDMREHIRDVMRFAGPRMIWRHPAYAVTHLIDKKKDEINQVRFKAYNIK